MDILRHFSDTRTGLGRVRFLLAGGAGEGAVVLCAEGPGWQHQSEHASLEDAALLLAFLPQVPQALYTASLDDLQRRLHAEAA